MKIRVSVPQDLEEFLKLVDQKEYPPSRPTNVTGRQRKQACLAEYQARWEDYHRGAELQILVAEKSKRMVAFLVLGLHHQSGLTGERQARILEHGGLSEAYEELIEAALAVSRQERQTYLTTRVYCGSESERSLFQALGFKPELTRVVKAAAMEDYRGPYGLRLAEPSDRLFMAMINARSTPFYLYANRSDDAQSIASRNFAHYLSLDLSQPARFLGSIVYDEEGPVGYVLLQNHWEMDVSGALGSYVYDVALAPKHWGSRASIQVSRFSHSQVKHMGRDFIFGDVSCDNPRTLRWAVRALGYQPDWERWGQPIGSWEFRYPNKGKIKGR